MPTEDIPKQAAQADAKPRSAEHDELLRSVVGDFAKLHEATWRRMVQLEGRVAQLEEPRNREFEAEAACRLGLHLGHGRDLATREEQADCGQEPEGEVLRRLRNLGQR